jgi:hypothetical protein
MSASSMNIIQSNTETETSYSTITSVYIPRVFSNIHPNVISQTFEKQNIGIVDHIQVIQRPKKGKCSSYMAFIYFKEWFANPSAVNLAERIADANKQARIVYDDPYYWIVLPNTTKRTGKSGNSRISVPVTTSSADNSSHNSSSTEKLGAMYLMIEHLHERVKNIEEYLSILHKYNSLSQLPSSPVPHPDDAYNYNYNYSIDSDTDAEDDTEVSHCSHRKGLNDLYTSASSTTATTPSPTKMVRVDSLGLVQDPRYEDDDSRFWCDP